MSKAILISIKPKYCEMIANGQKTIEIRKTFPKLPLPFVCYIYCTKDGNDYNPNKNLWKPDSTGFTWLLNGKVIGEFLCRSICHFDNISTDNWEFLQGNVHALHKTLVRKCARLSEHELHTYANGRFCFGWDISNLVIYDKPKALQEFGITMPPQSWRYVEEET